MKTWVYSWIVYPVLYALASVIGVTRPKIRDTLKLRSWKDFLSLRYNVGQPIEYWVHVASQGELEYAIPLLKELGRRGKRVLVTYYSISAKKPVEQLPETFPNVSLVVPLPHDGLGLMKEFVLLARRQGVRHLLLMKYELWPGLLWECNRHDVKVLLVDALKPGWFHRRLLHKLDGILSGYATEIDSLAHRNVKVVGDTRVERVLERVEQAASRIAEVVPAALVALLTTKPVLVCGSMWPPDTRLVLSALRKFQATGGDCHVVWVPHELDENQEREAREGFASLGFGIYTMRHSDRDSGVGSDDGALSGLSGRPVAVIVMRKGVLAELYRLGQAAYVGGGFGSGIHSVWEPALAGARVACGPRTERSPESLELATRGVLQRVETPDDLAGWMAATLKWRQDKVGTAGLAELISTHRGAAARIIASCENAD